MLYAPFKRSKKKIVKIEEEVEEVEEEDDDPLKIVRVYKEVNDFPLERAFKVEKLVDHDYGEDNSKLKFRNMVIRGLGIPPTRLNISGIPSVDTPALKELQESGIAAFFKYNK